MAIKHVDNKYKRIYNNMCYGYFDSKVIIFINGKKIVKGGAIEWKELISQKRDKEKKSMDSEKEWKLLTEEMF